MSEQPPAAFNICAKCGASTYPDAKYCQNCAAPVSLPDAPVGTRDWLTALGRERTRDFSSSYMVTLVSIIQTAALGYLLLAANAQLSSVLAGTYNPLWTVLIVAMFLMIMANWIQYARSMVMLRLTPTIVDDLIPFSFGITQAFAIFSIMHEQIVWFYIAEVMYTLVALISYNHTWRQLRLQNDLPENQFVLQALGTYPRFATRFCIAYIAIFVSFGVTEALLKLNSLFFAFVVLALYVLLFYSNSRRLS